MKKPFKFNPVKFGFLEVNDGDIYYVFIKNDKVVAKLFYMNYYQGIKCEWQLKGVIHMIDSVETKEATLFFGKIPDEAFGKNMLANTFVI